MAPTRGPYRKYLDEPDIPFPRESARRWDLIERSSNERCDQPLDCGSPASSEHVRNADLQFDVTGINAGEQHTTHDTNDGPVEVEIDTDDVHCVEGNGAFDSDMLFEGSDVQVSAAVCLLMTLFVKYKWTRECLGEVLRVVSLLLPKPNKLPATKYHIMKHINSYRALDEAVVHCYCKQCGAYLTTEQNIEQINECNVCNVCNPYVDSCVFVEFPIEGILRTLLENDDLLAHMSTYKEQREKKSGDAVEDVFDGRQFKSVANKTLPADDHVININLLWGCDGISISKSSTIQVWPLQIMCLDVHPSLRRRYASVAALWNGKTCLSMNTFLKPFCDSLKKLASGFQFIHPANNETYTCCVFAPVGTADAPARAKLQNIMQYNGAYGCSSCEHPGSTLHLDSGGCCHIYLPSEVQHQQRTGDRMLQQAETALDRGSPVNGVKGPSILSVVPYFDPGFGLIHDYMHCALLGMERQLANLWFDPSKNAYPYKISRFVDDVDSRLLGIKPLSSFSRVPRSIRDRGMWKASEWRAWLLFYSLPSLENILPRPFFQHYVLLVVSISILLQESISPTQINIAELLLKLFVEQLPSLYGEFACTYNAHQLTHLAQDVRNWGPLWVHSAFTFEHNNGQISRLIRGKQAIGKQLKDIISVMFKVSVMSRAVQATSNLPSELFLSNDSRHRKKTQEHKVLGKPCRNTSDLTDHIFRAVSLLLGEELPLDAIKIFYRCSWKHLVLTSKSYNLQKKRNNYTVCLDMHSVKRFGEIKFFCEIGNKILAVVDIMETSSDAFVNIETTASTFSVHKVLTENVSVTVVPVEWINSLCLRVVNCICFLPNRWEMNL